MLTSPQASNSELKKAAHARFALSDTIRFSLLSELQGALASTSSTHTEEIDRF